MEYGILIFNKLRIVFFEYFRLFGILGMYCGVVGVFRILFLFYAFIGFGVVFCIYEDILKVFFPFLENVPEV